MAGFLLKHARMIVRSTAVALGVALAGCTLGTVGGGGPVGNDEDQRPAEVLCEAQLTITGTFAPPGTPPGAELGCVPEGTWTVNVAVGDEGDCGAVPIATTYTYTVVGTGRDQMIQYTTQTGEEIWLNIHAGGNGECEGSFEHIWPAEGGFNVMLLKPWFEAGTQTMQGTGTFQVWNEHP